MGSVPLRHIPFQDNAIFHNQGVLTSQHCIPYVLIRAFQTPSQLPATATSASEMMLRLSSLKPWMSTPWQVLGSLLLSLLWLSLLCRIHCSQPGQLFVTCSSGCGRSSHGLIFITFMHSDLGQGIQNGPVPKGYFVHIGMRAFPLCAVQSLLSYLSIRGGGPGPLFLIWDGHLLSDQSWLLDCVT